MSTLRLSDLAFLAAGQTQAQVINVIEANTSATTNPNGRFSFTRKATATSTTLNLLTYQGTPGSFGGPDSFNLPLAQFSAGNLFLHPGLSSSNKVVSVRFISDFAGTVTVTGRYVKQNTGTSDGVYVSVYKNNSTVVVSPTLITVSSPVFQYTQQLVVAIGDTLDFNLDSGTNGGNDHTDCTILQIEQN